MNWWSFFFFFFSSFWELGWIKLREKDRNPSIWKKKRNLKSSIHALNSIQFCISVSFRCSLNQCVHCNVCVCIVYAWSPFISIAFYYILKQRRNEIIIKCNNKTSERIFIVFTLHMILEWCCWFFAATTTTPSTTMINA